MSNDLQEAVATPRELTDEEVTAAGKHIAKLEEDTPELPQGLLDLATKQLSSVPGSAEFQTANNTLVLSCPVPWMVGEALYQAQVALHNKSVRSGGPGYVEPLPELLPEQAAYLEEVRVRREAEQKLAEQAPPARRTGPAPRAVPGTVAFSGAAIVAGVSGNTPGTTPSTEVTGASTPPREAASPVNRGSGTNASTAGSGASTGVTTPSGSGGSTSSSSGK